MKLGYYGLHVFTSCRDVNIEIQLLVFHIIILYTLRPSQLR